MDQAALLSGDARRRKLAEGEQLFRSALLVSTCDAYPVSYATAQGNLGSLLVLQAGQLDGEARRGKLDEAERAFREALSIFTMSAFPIKHVQLVEFLRRIGKTYKEQWHNGRMVHAVGVAHRAGLPHIGLIT